MFSFCLQFLSFQISNPKSYQLCEDVPSPMFLAKCFLPQEAFFLFVFLTFSESATFSLSQTFSHCLLNLRLSAQTTGWVLFCSVSRWDRGIITFQIGVKRNKAAAVWAFTILLISYQKSLCVSLTHTYTHTHTHTLTAFSWLQHVWGELLLFEWQKRKIQVLECGWYGFKQAVPHSGWSGNHGEREGAKI